MTYCIGIDLGTTDAAAVVVRGARVGVVPHGTPVAAVPSVVYVGADGQVLAGRLAHERGVTDPGRTAHAFKRRVGDATPFVIGGRPVSAHLLLAHQLRAVVDQVVSQEGNQPAALTLTHPAAWGRHEVDLLRRAAHLAGFDDGRVQYLSEPEAAAIDHAHRSGGFSGGQMTSSGVLAVYDFGGGTFDATLVRLTGPATSEIFGRPRRIEHLGGVDVDAAIVDHVDRELDGAISALDLSDPGAVAQLGRLQADCARAKEILSTADEVVIAVRFGASPHHVRVTRNELEVMIRPAVDRTVDALTGVLRSAGVSPSELDAVMLVGGTSQVPFVANTVRDALVAVASDPASTPIDRRRIVLVPDPCFAVARGAAIVGARWLSGRSSDESSQWTSLPRGSTVLASDALGAPGTGPGWSGPRERDSWPPPPPTRPTPPPVPAPPSTALHRSDDTPATLDRPSLGQPPLEPRDPPRRPRWRLVVGGLSVAAVAAGLVAVAATALSRDDPPDEDQETVATSPSSDPEDGDGDDVAALVPLDEVGDDGDAWLSVYLMGGLAKIDMETREVVANVPVNGADSNLVTQPSRPLVTDTTVWVSTRDRQDGPTVYLVDRDDASIRHRVPLALEGSELAPLNIVRAHDGVWATFAGGGEAVAVLLDGDGTAVTTVGLAMLPTAEPVSDGTYLFAVSDTGTLLRVGGDGSVDELQLDGASGGVVLGDDVLYAIRSSAVDRVDRASMTVEASVELTLDGRPFELETVDDVPALAAIVASDTTVAFSTFDSGAIVNVVSFDAIEGRVATRDELPIGGASGTILPQSSASGAGPDGDLWVNVQQSVVRIEDGESDVIGIENPVGGAASMQDMAVVEAGVARIDTDDQGYPVVTTFGRDEREVSETLPLLNRTIAPMYEGGRFWLFGALRGPAVLFDANTQAVTGEVVEIDGISAGPTEVAGEIWVVTFNTNDPNDPDDNERELLILDPDDGSVVDRRPFEPDGALMSDGDEVWVSGEDFVKIDPATQEELERVPSSGYVVTPIGYAFGMGIPDDIGHGAIWNLSESGVRRIDTETLDVVETSIPGQMFSVTVAGDWVWATTVDGGMYRIDPDTGEISGSVDVGDELIEIAVAGSTPFAVEIDGGRVHRLEIDDGDDEVAATVDVGFGPVTWKAHQGFLWVANEVTGRLHQIDQQGEIAKTLLLDGRPSVIASDGGDHLLVGLQDKRAVSLIAVGIGGELAEIPLQ